MRIGEVDVLGFMASVDPEILNFWERYDAVYPLAQHDEQWMQHAVSCSILSGQSSLQAAAGGVKLESMQIDDFLPHRMRQKQKTVFQNTEEMISAIEKRYAAK